MLLSESVFYKNFVTFRIFHHFKCINNNLFEIGHYPELWKMSHVTAIYKFKGSKSDKVNYRPISLLPTLSKICESVIHHRLLSHCLENNIISTRRAAYIKGDSTVNQLLYIINKIRQSWGKKMCTQGVFLDVSSAFEKVWHKGLIAKLNQIGIEGKLLKLFESYLSNRRQIVVVDGIQSTETNICAGVPQGSRLGPILFIIYINDIVENLKSKILIFDDDCSLMVSAEDPSQSTKILNDDLETISKWASTWKITFNPDKSQDTIFSNKILNNSPPTVLNNEYICRVNTVRHLGLYLTSTLDWNTQIYHVCLKANRKLSVLRRVKNLQRNTLDLLYKKPVRSVIDYSIFVYYQTLTLLQKNKLDKIQYSAAKLVSSTLHYTSREKL